MIRLHVDQPLSAGTLIELGADQARYLTGVMRKSVGDELLVFNGRDGEWRVAITEATKRSCVLTALARTREQSTTPELELIVALVKRNRLETIIEKATELGCRRIRLAVTRYTQSDHARTDRLSAIATEASEQTGRLDVPEVAPAQSLDHILNDWPGNRRLMFCDEGGDVRPVLEGLPPGDRPWSILIGPEGGFSPEERARLRGLDFVTPVGLGPRILRADTAAIAALTLWQARLGDWRS